MIVRKIEAVYGSKKRCRVQFEEGGEIILYAGELRRLGLREGEEWSGEEYEAFCQGVLLPRAKRRALYLLTKQDRSRKNLYEKLRAGGYPEEICEEAVCYAESYHYIDDIRYAENYVKFHQEKKSRRRVLEDLLKRGIEKDIAEQAVSENYGSNEKEQMYHLMEKRHYIPDKAGQKEKASMYRYLLGRGYDPSDIRAVL